MRKSYGGTLARSALRLPLPPKPISFSLFANRERLRFLRDFRNLSPVTHSVTVHGQKINGNVFTRRVAARNTR
ncbi:MAG: hypothetical protein KatS3mg105_5207 [Gemmatales bacterium]|nr:MAG: hypothetical protein KatS3mg105_5207 [Gemmatales bacterium]